MKIIDYFVRVPTGIADLARDIPRPIRLWLVLGVLWGLLKFSPETLGYAVIALAVYNTVTKAVRSMVASGKKAMTRMWYRGWRTVKALRQFYRLPPELTFIYSGIITISMLVFVVLIVTKDFKSTRPITNCVGVMFLICAPFDCFIRIAWIFKRTWPITVWKFVWTGVVLVVGAIALKVSKDIVREIVHADPQYFQDSVQLFVVILTPIFCILALCLIASILASIEMLSMVLFMFVVMTFRSLIESIFGSRKLNIVLYRLKRGKKPPVDQPIDVGGLDSMFTFFRPMSVLVVAAAVATLIQGSAVSVPTQFNAQAMEIVKWMNFHSNNECTNLQKTTIVAETGPTKAVTFRTLDTGMYDFFEVPCKRVGTG